MRRIQHVILLTLLIVVSTGIALADQGAPPRAAASAARKQFLPEKVSISRFSALNFSAAAKAEAAHPPQREGEEIEGPDVPQPPPPTGRHGVPIAGSVRSKLETQSTPASSTGPSPGPSKTFKGEFLSSTSIPPDTMGAVGTTHVVTVTNDRMRIQTRDGIELSRMTLTAFWAGVTIKGAAASAFDPKVYFDRFNNRFILHSSANGQNVNSGALFAVSATADPTGTWYRWSVAADPTSTATGGHWIDYPTIGHNKNWIVIDENVFNFGTAGSGFWGTQIYVLDKQAAYSNTLGTINLFQGDFNATCLSSATPETELACGFTMAPAITEDNTTDTVYMVEDWDSTAAQLRLSKITGTAAAPVLTVGTQFPQSANSWRFDAPRISNKTTATTNGTTVTSSGGYMPQRQQSAHLTSGTRVMANDSRIQNSVYRGGTLWCAHTVMLSPTSQPAGVTIGGTGNPVDTHSGIQWWAIDPTNESGGAVAPLQRARIEQPTADNCHDGLGGQNIIAGRCTSTATQTGDFYAFPNISVNQNNDVFIGFTRFQPLTYPNSAYVIRKSTDPVNTTRDPVIFRPGQANYNIGAGTSTAVHPTNPTRQNRWGDYSAAQTDPLNDTDFWSVQEYAGTVRDFGIGLAGNWETWWAQVSPSAAAPSTSGAPIISEFRLRGPQGVRDEFVEIYNPGASPIIVNTTDGSDGWALAFSSNGTAITSTVAVIPNGTVIPSHGHFLIADNPDAAALPTVVYSLNGAPSIQARGADSDTGWSLDLADNGGIALFNTALAANFAAGTRLDSVGFSSIAAGLFKEGNGIPAVTAATPTGQMTFFRDSSSGVPADTGANENDFIFANTVVGETLGSAPKLGAAGPENLDGPVHATGAGAVVATLLDSGAGQGSAANLFRDPTVVSNGAFGTITFRRTLTNNTGVALPKLRYRIVNLSTSPGAAADLRAMDSTTGSVTLSGGGSVNVGGTTLETPPAQAAGGGFNGTFNATDTNLTAPFASSASTNLQFKLGVQVTGAYNLCLVAEGSPVAASSLLCFAGNTENTAPSITPGAPVARTAGAAGSSATIATVSDLQDGAGTLTVTVVSAPAGITITGITNVAGTVSATVAAGASVAGGTYNVTLQVADSEGATNTATLVVNVTPATPSITPGGPTTFCTGGSVTLSSSAAAGNQWYLNGNPIGGATGQTYVVTSSGDYTVVVTENTFSSAPSSITTVTVNPIPATPTITPGGPTTFCAGGSVTLTSSSASGNQWYLNGNPIGGATSQAYVANASGNYTVVVTATGCSSAPSAATVVTVNPIPATPTITPGGPTTFCAGGSVTLTSSSASGNQWYLNGNPIGGATSQTYVANASGNYTVVVTATGCSSAPSSATVVTVNPIPATPTITPGGPTTFCAGGSVTLTSSSASGNQWRLNGSPIGGATSQAYVASVAGDYSVVVTTSGCSSAASAVTTVTVNPNPNATITAPASVNTGSTGNVASVANAGVGATYVWGITNGTITAGAGTSSITFTAGAPGTVALNVTVTTSAGCSDTKSANVTSALPSVTVTSVAPNNGPYFGTTAVTINGTGFVAGATVTFGGVAATNVVVVSGIKITAKTPAHAAGAVNVVVTNPDTSSGTLTNGYTYNARRFDANGDNAVDPSDIFYLINYLFLHGPAPAGTAGMLSGDANGDGVVDPADIFYVVNYLFSGGQAPYEVTPGRPAVQSIGERMTGGVTLGQAVSRDGKWYIPVIVTGEPGNRSPQAVSLNVRFEGGLSTAAIHRTITTQPVFEISRNASGSLTYLLAFDDKAPLDLGAKHSAVIAEIEVDSAASGVRLEIDGDLTMLVDRTGIRKATVTNGGLQIRGTTLGRPEAGPQPQQQNHE